MNTDGPNGLLTGAAVRRMMLRLKVALRANEGVRLKIIRSGGGRLAFLLAGIGALVALAAAAPALGGRGMLIGASDDALKWHTTDAIVVGQQLSLEAFRVTLRWRAGQTALDQSDVGVLNDVTFRGGAAFRIVLSVYSDSPADAPVTAEERDTYCSFVRNVLRRYPLINDVVIWNEPNLSMFWQPQFDASGQSAAPAAYAALLAECYDALHGVRPEVNVIAPATSRDGNDNPWAENNVSHSPGNFIRELGLAYRASGRHRPIFDVVGHHPHSLDATERPWKTHAGTAISLADWSKLMDVLREAFAGTPQPIPGEGVPIWYLEVGYQTTVPADKEYFGRENWGVLPPWAGGEANVPQPVLSEAPDQGTQLIDAGRLAYCEPYVGAYFNFLLWDDSDLGGWQSGLLWRDGTRKESWEAFERLSGEIRTDRVDCGKLKGGPEPWLAPPGTGGGSRSSAQSDAALSPTTGSAADASSTSRPTGTAGSVKRTYLAYRGSRLATFGYSTLGAFLAEATRRGGPARPLAGRLVRFRVGGTVFTARTNRRGLAVVGVRASLLPGTFLVRADFAGEKAFGASHALGRLAIRQSRGRVWSTARLGVAAGAGQIDARFDGRRPCGFIRLDTRATHIQSRTMRAVGISRDGRSAWLAAKDRRGKLIIAYARSGGRPRGTFRLWSSGRPRSGRGAVIAGRITIASPAAPHAGRLRLTTGTACAGPPTRPRHVAGVGTS